MTWLMGAVLDFACNMEFPYTKAGCQVVSRWSLSGGEGGGGGGGPQQRYLPKIMRDRVPCGCFLCVLFMTSTSASQDTQSMGANRNMVIPIATMGPGIKS